MVSKAFCKARLGNKSRSGMAKPEGSGRKPLDDSGTCNVTIRLTLRQCRYVRQFADDAKASVGYVIRGAIDDLIDNYEH